MHFDHIYLLTYLFPDPSPIPYPPTSLLVFFLNLSGPISTVPIVLDVWRVAPGEWTSLLGATLLKKMDSLFSVFNSS